MNLFAAQMPKIASGYDPKAEIVVAPGDSLELLRDLPDGFAKLVITSPPYNIGKCYETATDLDKYLGALQPIINELVRVLSPEGSLCWQVGNYVENAEVFPLDARTRSRYYPLSNLR